MKVCEAIEQSLNYSDNYVFPDLIWRILAAPRRSHIYLIYGNHAEEVLFVQDRELDL